MSDGYDRVTEAQIRREWARIDRRAARKRAAIAAAVVLALSLVAGAMAAKKLFILADVRSDAMGSALKSGDVALCVRSDAPVLAKPAERGALALVRWSDNGIHREALRRVIALAGDEVSVDGDGRVTLNGVPLEEPYAVYRAPNDWTGGEALPGGALENPFAGEGQAAPARSQAADAADAADDITYPLTIPEGAAFVLCDDRNNALDSRSGRFGLVSGANLLGLARAVIWPLWRAGPLDGT